MGPSICLDHLKKKGIEIRDLQPISPQVINNCLASGLIGADPSTLSLMGAIRTWAKIPSPWDLRFADLKREYIASALRKYGGNISKIQSATGLARETIKKHIKAASIK